MTRKAHNVDKEATHGAHFLDRRSYWTNAGHVYVFGEDASIVRAVAATVANYNCEICGKYCDFENGQLHHIKGGNTDDRCWCQHNIQWICFDCHRAKHVHVKWSKQ